MSSSDTHANTAMTDHSNAMSVTGVSSDQITSKLTRNSTLNSHQSTRACNSCNVMNFCT
eukprot:m.133544 g.133544  ORF g.133544 m.133544 type:complete len:59 (-) comp13101_c0_seq16:1336-1512(-)